MLKEFVSLKEMIDFPVLNTYENLKVVKKSYPQMSWLNGTT